MVSQKQVARKHTSTHYSALRKAPDPPRPTQPLSRAEQERYNVFLGRQLAGNMLFNWRGLATFQKKDEIRDLISHNSWDRWFEVNEKVYRQLTLEFLSTFRISSQAKHSGTNNSITFRVNGQEKTVTIQEICKAMGFYTEEFLDTEEFVRLPVDWPPGEFNYMYWQKLSPATPYRAKEAKASTLREVNHRVIHWVITHSINGKGHSTGVVGTYELLYLHSIIERHPLNLGVMLAFFFHRQAKTIKAKGTIYCGAYITRLLKGLQLFPNEEPKDVVATSYVIQDSTLEKWFGKPHLGPSTSRSSPQAQSPIEVLTKRVEKNRHILQKMKTVLKALVRSSKRQQRHQESIYSCLKGIAAHNNVEFSPPHPAPYEHFSSSSDDAPKASYHTLLEDSDDEEVDSQIRASKENIDDEEEDDDEEGDEEEEEEDTPTPSPPASKKKKRSSKRRDDDDPDYQGN